MESLPAARPYSFRERSYISGIVVILALAHIVSFLYLSGLAAGNPEASPYPVVAGDSAYYALLTDNLITHHVYSDAPDLSPTRWTPPGYPVFLAAIKGVTGSFVPAMALQTVIALFAAVLIYATARRFVSWWLAGVIALLYGLEPMVVLSDTTVLTDGLFSALMVIVVYIGFFQSRFSGAVRAGLAGLVLSSAVMIRPIGEFLLVILLAAFAVREWLRSPAQREERHPLYSLAAYVLCASLVIAPWVVRNYRIFGAVEIGHGGGRDLLYYDVRDFLAWRDMEKTQPTSVYYPARHPQAPVFASVDADITAALAKATPPGGISDNYAESVGLHFIFGDPLRYAYFHLAHLAPYFLGGSVATYEQIVHQERDNTDFSTSTLNTALQAFGDLRDPQLRQNAFMILLPIVLELAYWLGIVFLALIGWFFERRRFETWLFAGLVGYFALLTGTLAIARYRIPAEPYLLLLAALGAFAAGSRFAEYRTRAGSDPRLAYAGKILRYLISGGAAFAVNLTVYGVLFYSGVWYVAASAVAFLVSFVVSFFLQKFFAFRDQSPPERGQQIFRYLCVLLFNVCANALMIYVLVQSLYVESILSVAVSNAVIALWNFFLYQRFIFAPRFVASPVHSGSAGTLSDVSVVIPCYNEADSLAAVLAAIPRGVREVVVVDNNSTDATARIATQQGAHVVSERRQGYGAAVRRGCAEAGGSVIAVLDGDGQHPPEELPEMLKMLVGNNLDFISASRFPLAEGAPMSILRRTGNWGLTLAANVLFGISLTDSQSGMVLFKKSLLPRIEPKSDDVPFVQELKIRAARDRTVRFAEYPIPCRARTGGESKVFPLRHGVKLLWELVVLRLGK